MYLTNLKFNSRTDTPNIGAKSLFKSKMLSDHK